MTALRCPSCRAALVDGAAFTAFRVVECVQQYDVTRDTAGQLTLVRTEHRPGHQRAALTLLCRACGHAWPTTRDLDTWPDHQPQLALVGAWPDEVAP